MFCLKRKEIKKKRENAKTRKLKNCLNRIKKAGKSILQGNKNKKELKEKKTKF